jgi:hypothetical protein
VLAFDAELRRKYGITHHDAGLDARDIERLRAGYELDPIAAAWGFGDDYDLIDLDDPWMRPTR